MSAIHKAFPGFSLIGEGRDERGSGEWCALLVDSERFAIRASGTFRLSPKDEMCAIGCDAACTRIATWAELVDRTLATQSFLVINTHFDHKGGRDGNRIDWTEKANRDPSDHRSVGAVLRLEDGIHRTVNRKCYVLFGHRRRGEKERAGCEV